MSKPLFVNEKEFDVQVGTPSGAGRLIGKGFAVEGDYFLSSVRAGMPLRQLNNDEASKFNPRKIVMSISLNEGAVQAEAHTPNLSPVASKTTVTQVETVKKAPDAVNKTLEETLEQAHKEMGTAIPTIAELNKMSLEQLNALATRYNISKISSRADLIKQLRDRLTS